LNKSIHYLDTYLTNSCEQLMSENKNYKLFTTRTRSKVFGTHIIIHTNKTPEPKLLLIKSLLFYFLVNLMKAKHAWHYINSP